jgi:hypothetical protein
MRKFFASALAALTFGTAVIATATPAAAEHRYYRRHHSGGGDVAAAAIVAGVAGLALGSALSSNSRSRSYYSSGYSYAPRGYTGYAYDPRYDSYSGGYGEYAYRDYGYRDYGYRTCIRRERAYDQYSGRRVIIERRYAC